MEDYSGEEDTIFVSDTTKESLGLHEKLSEMEQDIFAIAVNRFVEQIMGEREEIAKLLRDAQQMPMNENGGELDDIEIVFEDYVDEFNLFRVSVTITEHHFTGNVTHNTNKTSSNFQKLFNLALKEAHLQFTQPKAGQKLN